MKKLDTILITDLIATYEILFHVSEDERLTLYFGDYGAHYFKNNVTDEEIQPVYEKALEAIGLSEDEFKAKEGKYIYRCQIENDMRKHINL